jgi:hypothetical protein
MKFPITRSELLEYDIPMANNERVLKELGKRQDVIISNLCNDFERTFPTNHNEKKYVFRNIVMALMIPSIGDSNEPSGLTTADALKMFIDKLQLMFIDCKIEVDALNTNLTISW